MKEILGWKISVTPALNKKTLLQKYHRPAGLEPLLHVIPQTSICNRGTQKQHYTDYMLLPWTANKIHPALPAQSKAAQHQSHFPLAAPRMNLLRIKVQHSFGEVTAPPANSSLAQLSQTLSWCLQAGQQCYRTGFILNLCILQTNPHTWKLKPSTSVTSLLSTQHNAWQLFI